MHYVYGGIGNYCLREMDIAVFHKLNDVYELEIVKCMYNYVHRSLPHYLSDIFTFTHDIHIHETRQTSQIRPFTSLTV